MMKFYYQIAVINILQVPMFPSLSLSLIMLALHSPFPHSQAHPYKWIRNNATMHAFQAVTIAVDTFTFVALQICFLTSQFPDLIKT